MKFIKSLLDEAHERAALGLFLAALGLEIFTTFDDFATVGIFLLACVTLLGSARYKGMNIPDLGGLKDLLPAAPEDEKDES